MLSIPLNKLPCLKPSDVDVIELHDCFSANELITYEALGLCPLGKAGELIDNGDNTYGGKYVVNPSGGLISKVESKSQSNQKHSLFFQPYFGINQFCASILVTQ